MIRGDSFFHWWWGHLVGTLMIAVGIPWFGIALAVSNATRWEFETVFNRPFCWLTGHEWADRDKWGVEPVCLHCRVRRGESQ